MEWVVGRYDAHEEAREEGQENFGVFVTEIAYSPILTDRTLGALQMHCKGIRADRLDWDIIRGQRT